MTNRERLINTIKGIQTDKVPWSPNLAYWWQNQPEEITGQGEVEFLQSIGCDPLIRGHKPEDGYMLYMYNVDYGNCKVSTKESETEKVTLIETPEGNLTAKYILTPDGKTWFLTEHPVKEEEDYKKVNCLFDNMTLTPDFTEYEKIEKQYGEDILLMPMLAPELNMKSSFQALLEFWVGTEELVYAVADYPEVVEETLEHMKRVSIEAAKICADSPAEFFTTWEDTSTTNISPSYYEEYILPEINEWCRILHEKNKCYIQHACGHLKDVISLMGGSLIDGIESISPPPTGNIEVWEAAEKIPSNMVLIGGIEPTAFLHSSLEELEVYVKNLLTRMKGKRFVLANSDSCPPGVELEKFKLVTKIVNEFCSSGRM